MKKFLMLFLSTAIALSSCTANMSSNVSAVDERQEVTENTEQLTTSYISIDPLVTENSTIEPDIVPVVSEEPATTMKDADVKEVESSTTTKSQTSPTTTSTIQPKVTTSTETSKSAPVEKQILNIHNFNGTTSDFVNFRSLPDYSNNVIKTVNANTKLSVLNYFATSEFAKVKIGDKEGYINKNYINLDTVTLIATKDTKATVNNESKRVKKGTRLTLISTPDGYVLNGSFESINLKSENFVDEKEYKNFLMNNSEKELVTSFSTLYSLEEEFAGKAYNIELCCTEVTTVILNGENFNWHVVVGNTTNNEGYVLANVFSGGKVVKGYGGGVCQVATTIYNCVLNLDMEVIELHHHGLPVEYVDWDAGKDAAVGDIGQQNLIFKNDLGYDLFINAYTSVVEENPIDQRGKLTVEFYKIK